MVEKLPALGRRVVDAVRIPRSGDRNRKPEFPLSPVERHRLEKECGEILKMEDFGRENFGNFCKNMIALARQEGNPKGFASLRDQKEKCDITFNENAIAIHGDSVVTGDLDGFELTLYEYISYSPQKRQYGLVGDKLSDFQPFVTMNHRVPVSSAIGFFSYFKGRSESAFPKGAHYVRKEEKVADKEVQDFCRRVYGIYATDRLGLNFPQH